MLMDDTAAKGNDISIYGDGKQVRGVLSDVKDDIIFVTYETKVKEGKKNKKLSITDQIKFNDIIESKIKISFN